LALQLASILLAGGVLKFLGELVSNPLGSWIIRVFQSDDYGRQIGMMEEIAADLRFLGTRMKDPEERILVIVDDLDRCEPNRAVEMLKAVKLLLDFDRFMVLLGIDARIVGSAVEKHYENLLGKAGATGSQYLDKIIQIPFQIPPPSDEETRLLLYR
jgi:predicted KAP-like P-loop ATPase